MFHETEPLSRSKKVPKLSDAVAAQHEEFLDRQAGIAVEKGISLTDRLDELETEPRIPEESSGPLGIDWSIT